jgi:regulator of telomere elongation helicase 1
MKRTPGVSLRLELPNLVPPFHSSLFFSIFIFQRRSICFFVVKMTDEASLDVSGEILQNSSRALSAVPPPSISLHIDGIPVEFPFEPYPTQVRFMQAVLAALRGATNGLLESPTGTGKTLCMLCASLAWVCHAGGGNSSNSVMNAAGTSSRSGAVMGVGEAPRKSKPFRILYVSRTHAQLAQVMREFKRTIYAAKMKSAILGSREHMCVNRKVSQLPTPQAQSSACNSLRAERECRYFKGIHEFVNAEQQQQALGYLREVRDIEDLCTAGRARFFCPYFHQRAAAEEADIVFLPYSYITDSALRRQLPFLMDDAIVIMDEGHNVPSLLTSAGSHKLTAGDIATAINDASRAICVLRDEIRSSDAAAAGEQQVQLHQREEDFAALKLLLVNLEEAVRAEELTAPSQHKGTAGGPLEMVRPGGYMLTFLARLHVTRSDVIDPDGAKGGGGLSSIINQATIILAQTENGSKGLAALQEFLSSVFALDMPQDLLDVACRFVLLGEEPRAPPVVNGRAHNQLGLLRPPPGEVRRTVGFWCLDSSSVLQAAVAGARSVLVTSGTLSPMDHFAAELGIPFGVVHQGEHVIGDHQLFSAIMSRGPGGQRLNGGYSFRNNRDYRFALGMSVVNIARNVPGGMLVFFPSYVAMSGTLDMWKTDVNSGGSCTIWGMLCEEKAVFVEPTEAKELPPVVRGFQKAADESSRGAVLFAVCRGKVSEGVDFADRHGRCVIVTGIPYANHSDLFVRLKREYITSIAQRRPKVRGRLFTGDDWYRTEAMRAVNQCVGRVIRHRSDFGSIILADERFGEQKESISPWIARRLQTHEEFRQTYSGLAQFFSTHRRCAGASSSVPMRDIPEADIVAGHAIAAEGAGPERASAVPPPLQLAMAAQFAEEHRRKHEEEAAQNAARGASVYTPPPVCAITALGGEPRGGTVILSGFVGLQKQTLPTTGAVSRVAPSVALDLQAQPGPSAAASAAPSMSSKQLCAMLKTELPPESYVSFRTVITEIAKLHASSSSLTVDNIKSRFAELCGIARGIFQLLPAGRQEAAAQAFGCHIPEAYRKYYQQLLLRKRPRSAVADKVEEV